MAQAHLLALHIGPAQTFISRARRLRDLWFGSFLLSDISKAVACGLHKDKHLLIIPCAAEEEALAYLLKAPNGDTEDWFAVPSVVNVLLAQVNTNDPAQLAEALQDAAKKRLKYWADETYKTAKPLIRSKSVFDDQLGDVLEFHAAWVPWQEGGNYQEARKRVMTLLAASQGQTPFNPEKEDDTGRPKSSLDGLRPTVLIDGREVIQKLQEKDNKELAYRLRLARNEQLDAIGLIKRVATSHTLASATRVAIDPWVCGIHAKDPGTLAAVSEEMKKLAGRSESQDRTAGQGKAYRASAFCLDGQLLLKDQLLSQLRNLHTQPDEATHSGLGQQDKPTLENLRKKLAPLYKPERFGEPFPYYALIAADGDGLGKALEKVQKVAEDQKITAKLSTFSSAVPGIIKACNGQCLYAGGDDVLAAVPLHTMLDCAEKLREAYEAAMREYEGTLSVGIAVAHALEHLEDVRQWALEAESAAKNKADTWPDGKGNALAIHWHSRGGSPMQLRSKWKDLRSDGSETNATPDGQDKDLSQRLKEWITCFETGLLSDKSAFALESLAKSYALPATDAHPWGQLAWQSAEQDAVQHARQALSAQAKYLLDQSGSKAEGRAKANLAIDASFAQDPNEPQRALHQLALEWQVARHLLTAKEQASGKTATDTLPTSTGDTQ